MSTLDLTLEPKPFVRRVEVINGIGGRRRWSADDKARIGEETFAPNAVVSEIARRYGLTPPQQVFGWRRQARRAAVTNAEGAAAPLFVPAVVETPSSAPPQYSEDKRRRCHGNGSAFQFGR